MLAMPYNIASNATAEQFSRSIDDMLMMRLLIHSTPTSAAMNATNAKMDAHAGRDATPRRHISFLLFCCRHTSRMSAML